MRAGCKLDCGDDKGRAERLADSNSNGDLSSGGSLVKRKGFSLEAPLNVTRAPTTDEAGVYQTARVLFFLQPAHNGSATVRAARSDATCSGTLGREEAL